ncbi:MAG TPA: ABC transporter ATP-binding protein [Verrucomicrobiae bacterium]|nr:ABC transporter ATP-binding protein [Verrucomicrobiae bacterium]
MISFLRRLWSYVKPYKARLMMGLACGILYAFTNVALIGVVRLVINVVFHQDLASSIDHETAKAGPLHDFIKHVSEYVMAHLPKIPSPSTRTGMALLVSLIPVVMFLRSLFGYLNAYLMTWASAHTIADLRSKLFDHLQNLPLSFFSQANTGDLISRITSDTQTIQGILNNAISTSIRDPLTVAAMLIYNFYQYRELTLLSMIVLPVCVVPISIYSRKVRKSAKALQTHAAELSKLMHESFTGNRVVKAYNLEDTMLAQFRETTKKYVGHIMRVVRANEIPGSAMEFFGSIGIAAVIYYVSGTDMKPGDLLSFVGSIYVMYAPIKNVTRLYNQLHQAEAASARVFELLAVENNIVDPANPVPLKAAGVDVCFENIEFCYGEKAVLRNINLTVKTGQLVALVGLSGSGKTTLANLLPRFYDPQRGRVLIGATNIRDVSVKELRRQIAIVTQDTILFHDTFRNNIAAGSPGATDAEIEAAARAANAHQFILDKPEGYNTIIGEKGAVISGGQRQRTSIARAILKDAPILILDEATNALDAESERVVQEELEKLMKGRTTICIAHRLSTIQKADLIVVLKEGQIVETGTHAQLMQRGGDYWRLYEIQFRTEKREAPPDASPPGPPIANDE